MRIVRIGGRGGNKYNIAARIADPRRVVIVIPELKGWFGDPLYKIVYRDPRSTNES